MGYRIEYDGEVVVWKQERVNGLRVFSMAMVCLLLFGILSYHFWPEGWSVLETWIYPGDLQVTKAAFQNMADNLQAGVGISDAVTVFCREILDGAQISD